jgi:hypothetical protein
VFSLFPDLGEAGPLACPDHCPDSLHQVVRLAEEGHDLGEGPLTERNPVAMNALHASRQRLHGVPDPLQRAREKGQVFRRPQGPGVLPKLHRHVVGEPLLAQVEVATEGIDPLQGGGRGLEEGVPREPDHLTGLVAHLEDGSPKGLRRESWQRHAHGPPLPPPSPDRGPAAATPLI